ncbi:MAG: hypothetical protein GY714_20820 [Desulfobacterales bacterium]|nr:hypothetical protein [Desulfobacterales bacterium]
MSKKKDSIEINKNKRFVEIQDSLNEFRPNEQCMKKGKFADFGGYIEFYKIMKPVMEFMLDQLANKYMEVHE